MRAGVFATHSLMSGNPNLIDPEHACTSLYLINLEDTGILMFSPMLISSGGEHIIIKIKTGCTKWYSSTLFLLCSAKTQSNVAHASAYPDGPLFIHVKLK